MDSGSRKLAEEIKICLGHITLPGCISPSSWAFLVFLHSGDQTAWESYEWISIYWGLRIFWLSLTEQGGFSLFTLNTIIRPQIWFLSGMCSEANMICHFRSQCILLINAQAGIVCITGGFLFIYIFFEGTHLSFYSICFVNQILYKCFIPIHHPEHDNWLKFTLSHVSVFQPQIMACSCQMMTQGKASGWNLDVL